MALEAVVFPHSYLRCNLNDLYGLPAEEEEDEGHAIYGNWDKFISAKKELEEWNAHSMNTTAPQSSFADCAVMNGEILAGYEEEEEVGKGGSGGRNGRKKRKNSRRCMKNMEEVESQRMTHIAVERNRRKQMNHYLFLLRSLMPSSYVQRGDQASVISGAINFVKELEHSLQSLQVQKQLRQQRTAAESDQRFSPIASPLQSFFAAPQFSSPPSAAHIEVRMVESHANLMLLSIRRPKQLLKLIMELQNLHLSTLHLNVTAVEPMVLHSFTLKVEDECRLNSVDDIAAAVHGIVLKIQQ